MVATDDVNSDILRPADYHNMNAAESLYRAAGFMGLQPDWITVNGLFAVTIDGAEHYMYYARNPLNSDIGISLVRDKYVTRQVLERRGVANIPFMVTTDLSQAVAFLGEHGTIIAKPKRGSGSQDINLITEAHELADLDMSMYIFEKYITGNEFRYLILGGHVIAVHRSDYGTSVEHDRALKRISYRKEDWDPALMDLSLEIADIFGLKFAAVDYLIDAAGRAYVLEVNSRPGFKWFHAPTEGPAVDVAGQFLRAVLDKIRADNALEIMA